MKTYILAIVLLTSSFLLAQEPTPTPTPETPPVELPVTVVTPTATPEPDITLQFPVLPREIVEALRSILLNLEVTPGTKLLKFEGSSAGLQFNQITKLLLFLNDEGQ